MSTANNYVQNNNNIHFFEKLGIVDPFKVHVKDGSMQLARDNSLIKLGVRNAHALELLQVQLRHKTTKKMNSIANILESEEKSSQLTNWQLLMRNIIEYYVLREAGEIVNWSKCNESFELLSFSKEELLGFSLSMAKEKNIEGAVSGMIRLLKQEDILEPEILYGICVELVRFFSQGKLEVDKHSILDEWFKDIRLHLDFLSLLSSVIGIGPNGADEATPKVLSKIIKILESIKISHKKRPREVSVQTWNILQGISYCSIDSDLPDFVLVESKSLPRSGHHYLKNLLHTVTNGQFSYCESYHEPGCCKANPCGVNAYWHYARLKQVNHLRLIKSHDFLLNNKIFNCMPGMYRLIQIREPFDLLVSWLELAQLEVNKVDLKENNIDLQRIYLYHETSLLQSAWEIIDSIGKTMNAEQSKEWLISKKHYINSFLAKWVPISNSISGKESHNCGNFVLRYQDMKDPTELLNLLKIKDFARIDIPSFKPNVQNVLKRKSTYVTNLIESNFALIQEISREIEDAAPLLADGGNVWRQVFEGDSY